MKKTFARSIGLMIILVITLTTLAVPASAASVYCYNCNQNMLYCCESTEYPSYGRYCDNAPTFWHEHVIEKVYSDYMCMRCGDVKSVLIREKEYCPYGNMPRFNFS